MKTESSKAISDLQFEAGNRSAARRPKMSQGDLMESCHELIFDVRDGVPVFHVVMPVLDGDEVLIEIAHMLDILIDSKGGEDHVDDEVRNTLALAVIHGVPVYPNTAEVAPELAKYHRRMLLEGFTAPDEKGRRVKLQLTESPGQRIHDHMLLQELDPTESVSPADLILIRQAIGTELEALSGAKRLLLGLRAAIAELNSLLALNIRNENSIQRCLTDHPLLFGPDYVRVIPKHQLGAEYEMDYALVRGSGLIDLVEIESPSLPLFNKKGDPSSHLVHAEQQVLDWIDWIELHGPYARSALPGLLSPTGYVVIGRSADLNKTTATRLRRRNAIFQPRVVVLTYDDLISRAQNLLAVLEDTPN